MEAMKEGTVGFNELMDKITKAMPQLAPASSLPTRELITILSAAAMCIGKDPKYVEVCTQDIRDAALGLADVIVD